MSVPGSGIIGLKEWTGECYLFFCYLIDVFSPSQCVSLRRLPTPKYHKHGAMKQQNFILSEFWRLFWKFKSKMLAGLVPSEDSEGESMLLSCFLVMATLLSIPGPEIIALVQSPPLSSQGVLSVWLIIYGLLCLAFLTLTRCFQSFWKHVWCIHTSYFFRVNNVTPFMDRHRFVYPFIIR